MNIILKIIQEEIKFKLLTEDYESEKEIKVLSNDIILKLAEVNLPKIKDGKGDIEFLKGISFKELNPSKYDKLKEFVRRMNIMVLIEYDTGKRKGSYSMIRSNGEEFNPNIEREIQIYIDYDSLKKNLIELYNQKGENLTTNDIYFKLFYPINSSLTHELNHAYLDFISKNRGYHTKQAKKYFSKDYSEIENNKEELIKKSLNYLNLPHEVWARFSQSLYRIHFMNVDFGENSLIYSMKDINDVVKDFKRVYENFNVLPDKMKNRLIKAVVQFWHKEQETLDELNKNQQ